MQRADRASDYPVCLSDDGGGGVLLPPSGRARAAMWEAPETRVAWPPPSFTKKTLEIGFLGNLQKIIEKTSLANQCAISKSNLGAP